MYNARIEGLLTRSSEISPFISSSLKVDSQFSNCSGGPRHKERLRNITQNVPKWHRLQNPSYNLLKCIQKRVIYRQAHCNMSQGLLANCKDAPARQTHVYLWLFGFHMHVLLIRSNMMSQKSECRLATDSVAEWIYTEDAHTVTQCIHSVATPVYLLI